MRVDYKLAAALMLVGIANGQTAATSAGNPAADEPIALNPFVITSTTDNGYAPTETLSGTRLRTSAKDVPTAMSIISRDMLNDLGALDFNDVLDYLPSTASYRNNASDLDMNGPRTGTPFTVRGFRSDNLTTNFFTSWAPIDTYNTQRMTFTRGPNSIVFGVGNPGGGLDVETNVPDLNRNSGAVEFRVDTFGSNRANADANYVLVPQKLGLRVDALQQDLRNYVTAEKRERRSLYLSSTYRPFKDTTITIEGENNRIRNQLGQSVENYDGYTLWALAGKPIKPVFGNTAPTPGISYNVANGYIVAIGNQTSVAPMDWSSAAYGAQWVVNGAVANRVSFIGAPVVPLNVNLLGEGDQVNADSNNATVFVQQAVGKNLSIEVAGKFEHQYLYNFQGMTGTDATVHIDANAQLPNGQPNPMAGMPYVDTAAPFYVARPTNEAQGRVTASYHLDLNSWRVFGRGFGSIDLSGLYSYDRQHQLLDNFREVNLTPLRTTGTLGQLNNLANAIHRRTYLVPGVNDYFKSDWAPINAGGIHSGWARVRATPRDDLTYTNADAAVMQAKLLDDLLVFTGGLRSDRTLQYSAQYVRNNQGVFPGIAQSSTTLVLPASDTTYSVGAVVNPTKWVSLFANKASNYTPSNQSSVTINGQPAAPMEGQGYDFGVRFNFFGGKLLASVDRFSSTQDNILDNTLTANSMNSAIAAIWQAINPNRDPGSWVDFMTQRTTGYEFQVVGNPTSNLRLMLTASQNKPVVSDRGAQLFSYVAANMPTWVANSAVPVSSTLGPNVGAMVTIINRNVANDKATIGILETDVSEWQFSGVARYQLPGSGWWKGFAVGTAFFWRGAPVIGFQDLPGSTNFNVTAPYYGAKTLRTDLFVDYSRRLFHKKILWQAQLRIQNLLDDRTAKPWTALDDGTGARFVSARLFPSAIGASLSSKFSF